VKVEFDFWKIINKLFQCSPFSVKFREL
jgi:hypothetical protein